MNWALVEELGSFSKLILFRIHSAIRLLAQVAGPPQTAHRAACHGPTNSLGAQPLTKRPWRKSVIGIIFHELERKGEMNDTVK